MHEGGLLLHIALHRGLPGCVTPASEKLLMGDSGVKMERYGLEVLAQGRVRGDEGLHRRIRDLDEFWALED